MRARARPLSAAGVTCARPSLQDPLEFPAHELKKYFRMGDHVKVIAGRYEGDTGLIVRVEENFVILFSDLTMHEVRLSEHPEPAPNRGQTCWSSERPSGRLRSARECLFGSLSTRQSR